VKVATEIIIRVETSGGVKPGIVENLNGDVRSSQ